MIAGLLKLGRALGHNADYLALAGCAAACFYASMRGADALMDDTLITLAYAKNAALGHGFIYNAPPPTFGATSPLQLGLMAILGVIAGPERLPLIAALCSALWLTLAALVLLAYREALGIGRAAAVLAGVLWLGAIDVQRGGEACLFLFLLLCALVLWARGQTWWFGAAVGALFLARGEGALLGALWALERAGRWARDRWQGQRAPIIADFIAPGLRAAGGFLLVAGPVCLLAYLHFGAVLPDTLRVKIAHGHLPGAQTFGAALWRAATQEWGAAIFGGARIIWWLFAAEGLVWAWRKAPGMRRYFAWIAAYIAAYALLGVVQSTWYHVPVYFAWLAMLGLSLGRLAPTSIAATRGVACLFAAAMILLQVNAGAKVGDPRANAYREIAAWMRANARADATLAAREVGYLGFYCDNPIVDLDGLTDPSLLPLALRRERETIFRERGCDFYVAPFERPAPELPPLLNIAGTDFACVGRHEGSAAWPMVYGLYVNLETAKVKPGVALPEAPAGTRAVPLGSDKI
jgi:hypothetical protein